MSSAFLEVALSNGYIFNNACNNDIVLYTSDESTDLYFGVKSNVDAGMLLSSSNINFNVQPANSNGSIQFRAGGANLATLLGNGYFGLGTTVPVARYSISNGGTTNTGGTGDMTNITSNVITMYDGNFPRIVHRSGAPAISTVYNFESNKNVYFGEQTDCNFNYYSFRGRRVCIGYADVAPSNHALDINGNISLGSTGADFSVSSAGQLTLWGNRAGAASFSHMIYAVGSNGANTQGDHIFFTRGNVTERMRIYSAGNVTVGGATATQALDVNGSVRINSANNTNNKLLVLWDGGTGDAVATACNFYGFGINLGTLRYQTTSTENHVFFQGTTARMLVGSNVGIGTITPVAALDVSGTTRTTNLTTTGLTGYLYGNGASAVSASTTIPVGNISGTLPVGNGGTGATTLTGYLVGNGTSAFTAVASIPSSAISGTLAVANGGTGTTSSTGSGSVVLSSGAGMGATYFSTSFYPDNYGAAQKNPSSGSSVSVLGHFYGGTMLFGRSDTTTHYWRMWAKINASFLGTDYLTFRYSTYNGTSDWSEADRFIIYSNGNATLAGTLTQSSDIRVKKDIRVFDKGLSVLKQIQPKYYKYNGKFGSLDDDKERIGIIAQEVCDSMPEMIYPVTRADESNENKETEILTVDDKPLIYVLINAVKEQQVIIEQQQHQISNLEERFSQQNIIIEQLQQKLKDIYAILPQSTTS